MQTLPSYSIIRFLSSSPPTFGSNGDRFADFRSTSRHTSYADRHKFRQPDDFLPVIRAIKFIKKHIETSQEGKSVSPSQSTTIPILWQPLTMVGGFPLQGEEQPKTTSPVKRLGGTTERLSFPAPKAGTGAPTSQPLSMVQASTMRSLMPTPFDIHLFKSADIALGRMCSRDAAVGKSQGIVTPSGEKVAERGSTRLEADDPESSVARRTKQLYRHAQGKLWR